MQVESDQTLCPACGAAELKFFALLHHMICAYVGPQYDFAPTLAGHRCPKCRRAILLGDPGCEIVGTSARCENCSNELIVFPRNREAERTSS
jgi:hypothetical protein